MNQDRDTGCLESQEVLDYGNVDEAFALETQGLGLHPVPIPPVR